jgi:hypothetical protein
MHPAVVAGRLRSRFAHAGYAITSGLPTIHELSFVTDYKRFLGY